MEALQPYEVNVTAKIKAIVGYTTVLLDNNSMKCKLGECNLGNLITDAYVDYVSTVLLLTTQRHYAVNLTFGAVICAVDSIFITLKLMREILFRWKGYHTLFADVVNCVFMK